MNSHMKLKITRTDGSVLTSGPMTRIPFVAGMYPHVHGHLLLRLELLAATWPGTLVSALFGVRQTVFDQMTLTGRPVLTTGPFTDNCLLQVNKLMTPESVVQFEGFTASLVSADKLQFR